MWSSSFTGFSRAAPPASTAMPGSYYLEDDGLPDAAPATRHGALELLRSFEALRRKRWELESSSPASITNDLRATDDRTLQSTAQSPRSPVPLLGSPRQPYSLGQHLLGSPAASAALPSAAGPAETKTQAVGGASGPGTTPVSSKYSLRGKFKPDQGMPADVSGWYGSPQQAAQTQEHQRSGERPDDVSPPPADRGPQQPTTAAAQSRASTASLRRHHDAAGSGTLRQAAVQQAAAAHRATGARSTGSQAPTVSAGAARTNAREAASLAARANRAAAAAAAKDTVRQNSAAPAKPRSGGAAGMVATPQNQLAPAGTSTARRSSQQPAEKLGATVKSTGAAGPQTATAKRGKAVQSKIGHGAEAAPNLQVLGMPVTAAPQLQQPQARPFEGHGLVGYSSPPPSHRSPNLAPAGLSSDKDAGPPWGLPSEERQQQRLQRLRDLRARRSGVATSSEGSDMMHLQAAAEAHNSRQVYRDAHPGVGPQGDIYDTETSLQPGMPHSPSAPVYLTGHDSAAVSATSHPSATTHWSNNGDQASSPPANTCSTPSVSSTPHPQYYASSSVHHHHQSTSPLRPHLQVSDRAHGHSKVAGMQAAAGDTHLQQQRQGRGAAPMPAHRQPVTKVSTAMQTDSVPPAAMQQEHIQGAAAGPSHAAAQDAVNVATVGAGGRPTGAEQRSHASLVKTLYLHPSILRVTEPGDAQAHSHGHNNPAAVQPDLSEAGVMGGQQAADDDGPAAASGKKPMVSELIRRFREAPPMPREQRSGSAVATAMTADEPGRVYAADAIGANSGQGVVGAQQLEQTGAAGGSELGQTEASPGAAAAGALSAAAMSTAGIAGVAADASRWTQTDTSTSTSTDSDSGWLQHRDREAEDDLFVWQSRAEADGQRQRAFEELRAQLAAARTSVAAGLERLSPERVPAAAASSGPGGARYTEAVDGLATALLQRSRSLLYEREAIQQRIHAALQRVRPVTGVSSTSSATRSAGAVVAVGSTSPSSSSSSSMDVRPRAGVAWAQPGNRGAASAGLRAAGAAAAAGASGGLASVGPVGPHGQSWREQLKTLLREVHADSPYSSQPTKPPSTVAAHCLQDISPSPSKTFGSSHSPQVGRTGAAPSAGSSAFTPPFTGAAQHDARQQMTSPRSSPRLAGQGAAMDTLRQDLRRSLAAWTTAMGSAVVACTGSGADAGQLEEGDTRLAATIIAAPSGHTDAAGASGQSGSELQQGEVAMQGLAAPSGVPDLDTILMQLAARFGLQLQSPGVGQSQAGSKSTGPGLADRQEGAGGEAQLAPVPGHSGPTAAMSLGSPPGVNLGACSATALPCRPSAFGEANMAASGPAASVQLTPAGAEAPSCTATSADPAAGLAAPSLSPRLTELPSPSHSSAPKVEIAAPGTIPLPGLPSPQQQGGRRRWSVPSETPPAPATESHSLLGQVDPFDNTDFADSGREGVFSRDDGDANLLTSRRSEVNLQSPINPGATASVSSPIAGPGLSRLQRVTLPGASTVDESPSPSASTLPLHAAFATGGPSIQSPGLGETPPPPRPGVNATSLFNASSGAGYSSLASSPDFWRPDVPLVRVSRAQHQDPHSFNASQPGAGQFAGSFLQGQGSRQSPGSFSPLLGALLGEAVSDQLFASTPTDDTPPHPRTVSDNDSAFTPASGEADGAAAGAASGTGTGPVLRRSRLQVQVPLSLAPDLVPLPGMPDTSAPAPGRSGMGFTLPDSMPGINMASVLRALGSIGDSQQQRQQQSLSESMHLEADVLYGPVDSPSNQSIASDGTFLSGQRIHSLLDQTVSRYLFGDDDSLASGSVRGSRDGLPPGSLYASRENLRVLLGHGLAEGLGGLYSTSGSPGGSARASRDGLLRSGVTREEGDVRGSGGSLLDNARLQQLREVGREGLWRRTQRAVSAPGTRRSTADDLAMDASSDLPNGSGFASSAFSAPSSRRQTLEEAGAPATPEARSEGDSAAARQGEVLHAEAPATVPPGAEGAASALGQSAERIFTVLYPEGPLDGDSVLLAETSDPQMPGTTPRGEALLATGLVSSPHMVVSAGQQQTSYSNSNAKQGSSWAAAGQGVSGDASVGIFDLFPKVHGLPARQQPTLHRQTSRAQQQPVSQESSDVALLQPEDDDLLGSLASSPSGPEFGGGQPSHAMASGDMVAGQEADVQEVGHGTGGTPAPAVETEQPAAETRGGSSVAGQAGAVDAARAVEQLDSTASFSSISDGVEPAGFDFVQGLFAAAAGSTCPAPSPLPGVATALFEPLFPGGLLQPTVPPWGAAQPSCTITVLDTSDEEVEGAAARQYKDHEQDTAGAASAADDTAQAHAQEAGALPEGICVGSCAQDAAVRMEEAVVMAAVDTQDGQQGDGVPAVHGGQVLESTEVQAPVEASGGWGEAKAASTMPVPAFERAAGSSLPAGQGSASGTSVTATTLQQSDPGGADADRPALAPQRGATPVDALRWLTGMVQPATAAVRKTSIWANSESSSAFHSVCSSVSYEADGRFGSDITPTTTRARTLAAASTLMDVEAVDLVAVDTQADTDVGKGGEDVLITPVLDAGDVPESLLLLHKPAASGEQTSSSAEVAWQGNAVTRPSGLAVGQLVQEHGASSSADKQPSHGHTHTQLQQAPTCQPGRDTATSPQGSLHLPDADTAPSHIGSTSTSQRNAPSWPYSLPQQPGLGLKEQAQPAHEGHFSGQDCAIYEEALSDQDFATHSLQSLPRLDSAERLIFVVPDCSRPQQEDVQQPHSARGSLRLSQPADIESGKHTDVPSQAATSGTAWHLDGAAASPPVAVGTRTTAQQSALESVPQTTSDAEDTPHAVSAPVQPVAASLPVLSPAPAVLPVPSGAGQAHSAGHPAALPPSSSIAVGHVSPLTNSPGLACTYAVLGVPADSLSTGLAAMGQLVVGVPAVPLPSATSAFTEAASSTAGLPGQQLIPTSAHLVTAPLLLPAASVFPHAAATWPVLPQAGVDSAQVQSDFHQHRPHPDAFPAAPTSYAAGSLHPAGLAATGSSATALTIQQPQVMASALPLQPAALPTATSTNAFVMASLSSPALSGPAVQQVPIAGAVPTPQQPSPAASLLAGPQTVPVALLQQPRALDLPAGSDDDVVVLLQQKIQDCVQQLRNLGDRLS